MGLLGRCPDSLRADFQRVYGLDIDGLWDGALGVARAADLAANLPAGSVSWIAVDSPAAWTAGDYLLANLQDGLAMMYWDGEGARPEPVRRPGTAKGDMEDDASSACPKELMDYLYGVKRVDVTARTHAASQK